MKYVLIDEETLKDNGISKEHSLTANELQTLMVHKGVLSKFILQRAYNIQTELGNGGWKEKEALAYNIMKELATIANDINGSEDVFNTYLADLKQKEELKATGK